jgi:2-polyprenyl-6-methoxyphenol hydroxylase-like FAD-dependent oxidoreductase
LPCDAVGCATQAILARSSAMRLAQKQRPGLEREMEPKKVLISGAGIAGLTLAYWLEQYGFSPTLVEKRADVSDKGYMIDFWGQGFDVAEKMGLEGPLQNKAHPFHELILVDDGGRQRAAMDMDGVRTMLDNRAISLLRGDLEALLYECICDRVPCLFQTQIDQIEEQRDHVRVTLSNGDVRDADMVIGADGIHSRVRAICWGDARQFEEFLGYYVACAMLEGSLKESSVFYSYLAPGSEAGAYAIGDGRLATLFAFKSEQRDIKSPAAQRQLLKETFGGQGWIIPQLLDGMLASEHLYFDAVSQVHVDPWHKGRVALVGDACQCVTLLAGKGASLAMHGAYVLASALRQAGGDESVAFPAYEAEMRPLIEGEQAKARQFRGSFVPDNRFSIWLSVATLKASALPGLRSIFLGRIAALTK